MEPYLVGRAGELSRGHLHMVVKKSPGSVPKMPESFRLMNYSNLFRSPEN